MDLESFNLLGKRARLDATEDNKLPLLINESWGSKVLEQAYKDRLTKVGKMKLFEHLNQHQVILVTGPYRSGVKLASTMMGGELGYHVVEIPNTYNSFEFFKGYMEKTLGHNERAIFCAPSMSAWCHVLPEDIAVVFMMRPVNEIIESQMKLNWQGEDADVATYPIHHRSAPVSEMKYKFWYNEQKNSIKYAYEVVFGSLKKHHLWQEDEDLPSLGTEISNG